MAGRTRLHDLLASGTVDQIAQRVRAGAFPYIAAQAAGIPERTHYHWMSEGEEGKEPYRQYWEKVAIAAMEARALAEVRVRTDNPLAWLRYGPGRSRPGAPGWTDSQSVELTGPGGGPVRVMDEGSDEARIAQRVVEDPELARLVGDLFSRLAMGEDDADGLGPIGESGSMDSDSSHGRDQ